MNKEQLNKIDQRFQFLADLQDGWLDGRGKGYTSEHLTWAKEQLLKLITNHNFPIPHIYPHSMPGMIQMEWETKDFTGEAKFDVYEKTIEITIW